MTVKTDVIPSYEPEGTESLSQIPERFLIADFLTLSASGDWYVQGEKLEHEGAKRFLLQQLRQTEEGSYWVVNGPQRVLVKLEDTPFLITGILISDEGVDVRLNDRSVEKLQAGSLRVGDNEMLYALVKQGLSGAKKEMSHSARLTRGAVLQLSPLLSEGNDGSVVFTVEGHCFTLSS